LRDQNLKLILYKFPNMRILKHGSFVLISALLFASCDIRNMDKDGQHNHSDKKSETPITDSTSVQVIDTVYNFGKVTDGEKVEYNFRFKNTGKKPLIIQEALASCGCTVPEKPEEPIPPGQIGTIKVVFDSKGRPGVTMKEVTVRSNARPEFTPMKLTGEVVAKQ
jgi:hypothetical protein